MINGFKNANKSFNVTNAVIINVFLENNIVLFFVFTFKQVKKNCILFKNETVY